MENPLLELQQLRIHQFLAAQLQPQQPQLLEAPDLYLVEVQLNLRPQVEVDSLAASEQRQAQIQPTRMFLELLPLLDLLQAQRLNLYLEVKQVLLPQLLEAQRVTNKADLALFPPDHRLEIKDLDLEPTKLRTRNKIKRLNREVLDHLQLLEGHHLSVELQLLDHQMRPVLDLEPRQHLDLPRPLERVEVHLPLVGEVPLLLEALCLAVEEAMRLLLAVSLNLVVETLLEPLLKVLPRPLAPAADLVRLLPILLRPLQVVLGLRRVVGAQVLAAVVLVLPAFLLGVELCKHGFCVLCWVCLSLSNILTTPKGHLK